MWQASAPGARPLHAPSGKEVVVNVGTIQLPAPWELSMMLRVTGASEARLTMAVTFDIRIEDDEKRGIFTVIDGTPPGAEGHCPRTLPARADSIPKRRSPFLFTIFLPSRPAASRHINPSDKACFG